MKVILLSKMVTTQEPAKRKYKKSLNLKGSNTGVHSQNYWI
jgi:hypothetical protein